MKITKYLKCMFPCVLVNILTLGILSAQEYAFMYIANGTGTATSLSNSSWHTVGSGTDNDFVEATTSTNWSYASNRLTASASGGGTYLVKFSLSFSGAVTTWNVGISVNGAPPSDVLFQRTISNANKDAGNVSGSAHLSISNSDYIELQVKPTDDGSDFTPIQAQVTLVKLTDNSTNYYGGMRIYNNATAQNMTTSYATVTGFSSIAENNDWTLASSVLTAGSSSAGTYFLTFSASFSGYGSDTSPANLTIGIAQNGSSNDPTLIITNRKTSLTDIGNVVGCGILTISSGDKISIEAKSGNPNQELTVRLGSLSLYKISGTSSSSYGGMEITSDQTVTISTLDTWTEVGTYTTGSLNNWTFSSNTLNATSGTQSAGIYLVDYSISVSPVAGTNQNILAGIFVAGVEHKELTVKRMLASSLDVGATGGTGIINIASKDSTITVKVKNESSTNNIIVKKSRISLHRFVEGSHDGSLPVELSSLSGQCNNGKVILQWVTESEIENLGFIVERREVENENSNWKEIASYKTHSELQGQGSVTYRTEYRFIDNSVQPGITYHYRLADVSYDGVVEYHETVEITIKSYDEMVLPGKFLLKAAYPNPFNPFTHISYILGEEAYVSIFIVDLKGRVVKQLIENENHSEGIYSLNWDGVNDNGIKLSSGVYFVVMRANVMTTSQKIVLLR